jgi:hypothetical protein
MNEQDIKQVLFSCKSQEPGAEVDPTGLYCDNLDVLEFVQKLEEKIQLAAARKERAECIKFVRSLNHLVADALLDKRGKM